MNPYVRPADSLPVSRRAMIMNAGLAAAALAGAELVHQLRRQSGAHRRRLLRRRHGG